MRIYYLLIHTAICCFATHLSKAQQAIVSGGATVTATGGGVSSSIGQVATSNATAPGGSISQGVQQPYRIQQVSVRDRKIKIELKVYPNPVTDNIWIEITPGSKGLSCQLIDAAGRMLSIAALRADKTSVSMRSYSSGIYFLNILQEDIPIQAFKITKTN